MRELQPIGELYKAGQYEKGLAEIRRLWDAIPVPKHQDPNSYMVIEYAVALSMKTDELDSAWEWALLGPECIGVRQDLGEAEFLIGKVAYERGDMNAARSNFLLAKDKSRGKIFVGEDRKYRDLIAR
jgi:hypothetical protein